MVGLRNNQLWCVLDRNHSFMVWNVFDQGLCKGCFGRTRSAGNYDILTGNDGVLQKQLIFAVAV
ncbi:hypothetical protein Q644_15275 [Brucella intermedia 229E]|uniref:Uncharacterized protein n=1 Tax=Brucella intermedia 229E TaxID=1337887 RepID=U4V9K1_9HYPH|nr:hypothetical protein Q644_15275 [Brucella intermedia 229E]